MADTLYGLTVDLKGVLDFASLERMPASFVTEHLGRRHADMLWKIQAVNEEWLYLLVLIEFQSTIDRRMALRMMNYAGGIWMGLGEDDLGPGGEYPAVLPVVVYNGEQPWNAATDVRDLLASAPEQLLGTQPRHPYLLIELQTLDPSTLPYGSVLSMIARFEQARSPEQLERLVATLADSSPDNSLPVLCFHPLSEPLCLGSRCTLCSRMSVINSATGPVLIADVIRRFICQNRTERTGNNKNITVGLTIDSSVKRMFA